jgi:SAM-dependent methyltransferase
MKCPICESTRHQPSFQYHEPPQGEVRYPLEGKYFREYSLCETCGHYFSSFRWPKNSVYEGTYVESTYKGIEGIRNTYSRIRALPPERSDNTGRVNYICDHFRQAGNEDFGALSLLDIGAGLGVFPAGMKEKGWKSHALDPDSLACRHMQEDLGIEVFQGDFFAAKIPGKFDLVSFNKVLEHVEDPVEMLRLAKPLLKKGGLVYLELPDGEGAAKESQDREEFFIDHLHVFSASSYSVCADRAGFQLIKLERIREPSTKYTLRGFLAEA